MKIARITQDPNVMGGRPCIRGIRVTVGTVLGLLAAGQSEDQILRCHRSAYVIRARFGRPDQPSSADLIRLL